MIQFENICDAKYDEGALRAAYAWIMQINTDAGKKTKVKKVFMYGKYPCIRVKRRKMHIHRLITAYMLDIMINFKMYVHHINGDKRDARLCNLEPTTRAHHAKMHNPKKKNKKEE